VEEESNEEREGRGEEKEESMEEEEGSKDKEASTEEEKEGRGEEEEEGSKDKEASTEKENEGRGEESEEEEEGSKDTEASTSGLSAYEKLRQTNIQERENKLAEVMGDINQEKEKLKVTFNLLKKPETSKPKKRKTFAEEYKEVENRRSSMRARKKTQKAKEAEEANDWFVE